jgi:hypothetical protein
MCAPTWRDVFFAESAYPMGGSGAGGARSRRRERDKRLKFQAPNTQVLHRDVKGRERAPVAIGTIPKIGKIRVNPKLI